MKALVMDGYKYYELPKGVEDLDSAIKYVNQNFHSFVKMKMWDDSKCVAPYFIQEFQKEEAVNISLVNSIEIEEIEVLPEAEYMERLKKCVETKCVQCEHNDDEEDLNSYRDKLSLDGTCVFYSKIKE